VVGATRAKVNRYEMARQWGTVTVEINALMSKKPRQGVSLLFGDPHLHAGLRLPEKSFTINHQLMDTAAYAVEVAELVGVTNSLPVLYFKCGESGIDFCDRLISSQSRLEVALVKGGRLNRSQWLHIRRVAERLGNAPIHITAKSILQMDEIVQICHRHRRMYDGLGIIVIDGLERISAEKIGSDSLSSIHGLPPLLAELANELQTPIVGTYCEIETFESAEPHCLSARISVEPFDNLDQATETSSLSLELLRAMTEHLTWSELTPVSASP
jgi:replicative DNA helicase